MKLLIRLVIFLTAPPLWAAQLTVDISSANNISSSSLVVNQELGALHPTLRAVDYDNPNILDFDVGDGRHGAFNSTTYSSFSVNGDLTGNVITIDVNQYPVLQVTSFTLDAGWTIEVAGDGPLIIYSLTDVAINGAINCQGDNGANAVGATLGAGGIGRCGGGDGGDGGAATQNGQDGEDADVTVTGGQGGNYTGGAAVSGGGGGSWWADGTFASAGTNSTVAGGQAGSQVDDQSFNVIAGGAGGGGGSGTPGNAGAGGGGAGGTIIINLVGDFTIGASGEFFVSGGQGGTSNAGAGSGGGGGGGSVRVLAGGTVDIYNGAGTSFSLAATGGDDSGGNVGGNGGLGRNWFTNTNGGYNANGGTGFYNPVETNITPGEVQFTTTTQSTESISFDLRSSYPEITSITTNPVSTDFTIEVRGSEDHFLNDDTGWTTDLSLLKEKRYIRLRASITTTTPSSPTMLSSIVVDFTPGNREEFDFAAASCGRVTGPKKPMGGILLLFPLILLFCLKRRELKSLN